MQFWGMQTLSNEDTEMVASRVPFLGSMTEFEDAEGFDSLLDIESIYHF